MSPEPPDRQTTKADELFNAWYAYARLDDEITDALLAACGIDPEKPDSWPVGDVTHDWYDTSFEFKGVNPDWSITPEQAAACLAMGFSRFWICYTDGTEVYGSGTAIYPRKPSRSPGIDYERRMRRETRDRIAALTAERDALKANLEQVKATFAVLQAQIGLLPALIEGLAVSASELVGDQANDPDVAPLMAEIEKGLRALRAASQETE